MHCRLSPVLVAVVLMGPGCGRDDGVRVYQAPKDRGGSQTATQSPAPSPSSAASTASTASSPSSPPQRTPWTVPAGWTEKPSTGGMRIATYAVTAPDGRAVDISVVPLGAAAGSLLDNVNRWRGELELAPVTEADLPRLLSPVKIGEVDAQMVELISEKPVGADKTRSRTLAAILPLPGTTVFFKAKGDDALVQDNAGAFKAWLKSVQTGPNPGGESTPPPSASGTAPGDMRGPVAPPPSTALPTWEVPSTWKSAAASTMRLASFALGGPGGQTGDLSVVALGPAAGGLLANIQRWRGQFGLDPVDEAGLQKTLTTVPLSGGETATVVDLVGTGEAAGRRLLGAIVSRSDRTWFYKLTGDAALVQSERGNFEKFIRFVKDP
ncbi:MAG: hypothetical protein ACKO3H_01010 [Verrucomicrobiota bacterium]